MAIQSGAEAVKPPGGQRPDRPGARLLAQQQPRADREQDHGLGQDHPDVPGVSVDEQVLDLAGEPVAVHLGQVDSEDGQPEHAEGHQPGRQLRGEDDGQDREAELGRDEPVSPAGHQGGRHRDGQQQQTPAAGLDALPQAIRAWDPPPLPHQDEHDAPDRQRQHNRDMHDRRLLPYPVLIPSWPSRWAAAMGLRPRTEVGLGLPWRG
jgi:hypothetical protein